ncbi:hypothetical protein KHA80_22575 [Anaerobacillus sp. HL2]|nr:hypothetical protein KHA80_22575 [Anaerobacillus sp. HL2]
MKENIDVFVPISEEGALRKEYEQARKNRDRKRQEAAKKILFITCSIW